MIELDVGRVCARCRVHKAPGEFPRRYRGGVERLQSWCTDCQRDNMRTRTGSADRSRRRANARASERRHPERRRAREQVKDAIRRGDLAAASACTCTDCDGPAQAYDHHEGYEKPLAVQPVCHECHGRRSRRRGEHRRR